MPDGPYDLSQIFLDGLNFPTGIVCWKNGVIVTAAPEIFYAEDTDGDGVCDKKTVLFSGFFEGNQQLRINGLRWGLDGWIHCASGSHHAGYGSKSMVRSHVTGKDIHLGSKDFRFHPATGELEPLSGPSQFGRNQDEFGNWFGVQNSYPLWHYLFDDYYLRRNVHLVSPDSRVVLSENSARLFPVAEIGVQPNPHTRVGRFTSACSGMVYRDHLLPLEQNVAHAFTCDPVHNLVQHNLLKRVGASFQMTRDASGEMPDFLASTDPWCRPVMVRTGPDGALWVVDMYRYLIEHPHWVPEAVQKEIAPLLRLGDGRGRLYRVVPENAAPHKIPDLLKASSAECVALLEHPNGWIRDAAQRRVVEIHDPASIGELKTLLKQSKSPQARLHALYALANLKSLNSEQIVVALKDPSEEIRRHAVKLAEKLDDPSSTVWPVLAKLADDPSEVVRFQLALSLGEWSHPQAIDTFARMWERPDLQDPIQTALFTSVNKNNLAVALNVVAKQPLSGTASRERYRQLLRQSVAMGDIAPIEAALNAHTNSNDATLRGLIALDVVYQQSRNSAARLNQNTIADLHTYARKIIQDEESQQWVRTLGISLLFQRPADSEVERELVKKLLTLNNSPALQSAVIRTLGQIKSIDAGELLLASWPEYLPNTKTLILETVAARPDWYGLLVNAIDQKVINPGEIHLTLQQRFLEKKNAAASKELAKRFQSAAASSGLTKGSAKEVLKLKGNAKLGQQVFQKHCIECHQFGGEGHLVGPNLASMTGRTPEILLDAIIDPNKAVEPKFFNYSISLVDGRILSGLIVNDSDNSLTLLKSKGETNDVLRADIEELRSTGKSLMPEGFDRTIPAQDLADLILYLQQSGERVSQSK